ncbi:MAG TPA: hypothetical protein VEZ90_03905 [Blastocatellia bacterium]|nr:hypothetical protein [Blastocatellia bacterium]
MEGRLFNQQLSVDIITECGHCGLPMNLSLDDQLTAIRHDEGSNPILFEPHVDWATFKDPTIIHGF